MPIIVRRRRLRIACWIRETSSDGSIYERQIWSFPATGLPPRAEAPAFLTDHDFDYIARRTAELLGSHAAASGRPTLPALPMSPTPTITPPDQLVAPMSRVTKRSRANPRTTAPRRPSLPVIDSTPPASTAPPAAPTISASCTAATAAAPLSAEEVGAMAIMLRLYSAAQRDALLPNDQRSVLACVHALLRSYLRHQTSLLHGDEDPIVILPDDSPLAACG